MLIKKMNNNLTLSTAFSLIEIIRQGVSKGDAATILSSSTHYMEKIIGGINCENYNSEQVEVIKALVLRLMVSNSEYRKDEFCDDFLKILNVNNVLGGHHSMFPIEISLTLASRAINKYSDFVFLLMLSEGLSYETYNNLISVGKDEINKSVTTCLAIFDKVAGGNISLFLFSSILEDALNTTINPVLESVSKDTALRQHFIVDPKQLLVRISAHLAEKVRSAIYLSDALVNIASK